MNKIHTHKDKPDGAAEGLVRRDGSALEAISEMAVSLQAKELYEASLPGGLHCAHRKYPQWRELPEAERERWRQCVNRAHALRAAKVRVTYSQNTEVSDRQENP